MAEDWRTRLRTAIKERGRNSKELSRAAGFGETYVRDILEGGHEPSAKALDRIAGALGMSLPELWDGEVPLYQTVPVIGCISAGEGWSPFGDTKSDEHPEEIEIRIEGGEPVALEVRGDSMEPVYRNGDVLIGAKRVGRHA